MYDSDGKSKGEGYVECDTLKTTYGTKSELIEDEEYKRFSESMRSFIRSVVLPKLSEVEVRRIDKAELRVLRRVDRMIGRALVESGLIPVSGGQVPPDLIRAIVQKGRTPSGRTTTTR